MVTILVIDDDSVVRETVVGIPRARCRLDDEQLMRECKSPAGRNVQFPAESVLTPDS